MNRTVKDNRDVPHPKPVKRVELSEKNTRGRLLVVILLLAFGSGMLVYAFMSFLNGDSGWREIQADAAADANCSSEFVFLYNIGASGVSASAENKAIVALYTQAAVTAYQLFQNDLEFDGVHNIYYINHHPNEIIEVDEALYHALELLQNYGSRYLYLAPVYAVYDNLFYSNDDSETVSYDPYQNETAAAEFAEMAAYGADFNAVDLELLEDDKICLHVSEDYLQYASENGITSFIDFYWMKNAFITDYLADVMIENHYTLGSISSYDGFIRNLDDSGTSYSFNLYDRMGQTVYPAAVMQYDYSASVVYLRNYPMNAQDYRHYYELAGGDIRTVYLDEKDGLCKASLNNLVSYSKDKSCAEVLLQMMPVYIADVFDEERLARMADGGVYSIYCRDGVICYNESGLTLTNLYDKENVRYTTSFVGE